MQKESIYKSKKLKLKKSFKLLLFIILIFNITSCIHKEKINVDSPFLAELIFPKTQDQGSFTDIKVKVTNRGLYPITIINMQISKPNTTIYYRGTTHLKALKHKFQKNKRFSMEYFLDKKLAGRKEHVIPEVHKIKSVVYPGKSKIYTLKVIAQSFNNNIYKNNINISYIYLDKTWTNKIYVFKGKSKPDENTVVKELYYVENSFPSKLEGALLASGDLGKVKYKNLNFKINLKGWILENEKIYPEYNLFLKMKDSWIYNNNEGTQIISKNGKTINIPSVNSVKPFIKTILHGKAKIHIANKDYKNLEKEIKEYNFILKDYYFEGKLDTKQLYDFLNKILLKGYGIHKHGEVLKIK